MYSDGIRIMKFKSIVADCIKDMGKISGREEVVKNVNCAKQMKEKLLKCMELLSNSS